MSLYGLTLAVGLLHQGRDYFSEALEFAGFALKVRSKRAAVKK
jgi:hypothetical protein